MLELLNSVSAEFVAGLACGQFTRIVGRVWRWANPKASAGGRCLGTCAAKPLMWAQAHSLLVSTSVAAVWGSLYLTWGALDFSGNNTPLALEMAVILPFMAMMTGYMGYLTVRGVVRIKEAVTG